MVIAAAPPRVLGVKSGARLRFGEEEKPDGRWAGRRCLFLDERPAFELSFRCGTCHFVLDGHHKLQTADEIERPLQLLSLLSVDGSLIEPDHVGRVPKLRAQPRAPRHLELA